MSTVQLTFRSVPAGAKATAIAVVTLNRPAAKNAINKQLWLDLCEALRTVRAREDETAAMVITGAGDSFCAGVDLKDAVFGDASVVEHLQSSEYNYLALLQQLPIPTVAAVSGACITGGFEIALNCDVIVASASAFFQDTHAKYGIVPGGGMTQLLPRIVGLQSARWMSLFGERLTAHHAHTLGLVCSVVGDDGQLLDAALTLAAKVAKQDARVTRAVKQMQNTGIQYSIPDALQYEKQIAVQQYKQMAAGGQSTKASLRSKFQARSKL